MKFEELNEHIPYARYGKEKSLIMEPYDNITLAMPGRHAEDTTPKGGDFVVMVTDASIEWRSHQFTHTDIFNDIQVKFEYVPAGTRGLMQNYLDVVHGFDPDKLTYEFTDDLIVTGMNPYIFLRAVQCLAVAEHRRYAQYEAKFGGRYLPFRFAAGIADGLWTADMGSEVQKYGRPAVERLEKTHGVPSLTEELMNNPMPRTTNRPGIPS